MSLGRYLSSLTKPELETICEKANFTEEEQKIFAMMSKGCSITEIAIKHSVCERTINRRIKNISSKMLRIGGRNGSGNS